jgi:small nuclear ribonucleoprotein (snRNP)-like protein
VRSRVIASRLRERVVVTLKTGDAFSGVLFSHDSKALVLRESEALGAGERRTNLALDGEIIVLLPDVAYIQKL